MLQPPHLCLGVGPCPGQSTVSPQFRHLGVEFVSEYDSEWHAFLCLVCSVPKHQTLVAGTDILLVTPFMHALRDVRRLLLQRRQNVARLVVKTWQEGRIQINTLSIRKGSTLRLWHHLSIGQVRSNSTCPVQE